MSTRVFDSFGHRAGVGTADYACEASEPSEVSEVEAPKGELRTHPELRKPSTNEKGTPSALARLRRAGIRLWLRADGWSTETSPKLVPMPRRHFFDLVEHLDEVRSELQAERGRRAA